MKFEAAFFNKGILCLALIVGLAGCGPFSASRQPGEIPVKLRGVNTSECPMVMTVSNQPWHIDYLGLYVSNPEVRIDGRWQALNFKSTDWQTKKTALLKFHHMCDSSKNSNTRLVLDASDKLMKLATNLRFTIGLPFDKNHARPAPESTVLHDNEMFLSRQSGHKFIRLELAKPNSEHRFTYVLGSAGCQSPSADQPPAQACTFTNRVEMILPTTQLDSELDLSLSIRQMVAQVDLAASEGCQFAPPETPVCGQLLHNLLHRPWIDWE